MLKRLFNAPLPEPNDVQKHIVMEHADCSLDSEIVSIAYEPRFGLIGFGTSRGQLFVINRSNQLFKSAFETKSPVLSLIPLINSSSFLGVSSRSLFVNHPNRRREENPALKGLASMSESSVKSMLMHWIIAPDRIVPKCLVIDMDIVSVAVSPTNPQYAMVANTNGSIMGFSIEDMKFTRLYVNIFEGKPVRSIFCEKGLTFLVCHEKIDRLEVKEMEFTDFANLRMQTFEKAGDHAAGIDWKGVPSLYYSIFNTMKRSEKVKPPEGAFGAYAVMISGSDWVSIVRSSEGDRVYLGKKEKLAMANEYMVPGAVVKYEDPYRRSSVQDVMVMNEYGKTISVESGAGVDHFPLVTFEPVFASFNDGVIKLFSENGICEIVNQSYGGVTENQIGIPLAVIGKKAITLENMSEICAIDMETTEKEVVTSAPVLRLHRTSRRLDFVCDGSTIISLDLTQKEEVRIDQNTEFYPQTDIKAWRRFQDSYAFITESNDLIFKEEKEEICTKKEEILFFEIVNPEGKLSEDNDGFIVIVSSKAIHVFLMEGEKLKRARKIKTSKKTRDASITAEGTLLVRTKDQVAMYVLPDPSYDPLVKVHFEKTERAILIPNEGFVIIGALRFGVYMLHVPPKRIYDPETPSLEQPQGNAFLSLFGASPPTIKEVDDGFQNHKYRRGMSNIEQTNQIMQQNILLAQERSELLTEMEMKSEDILKGAQKFRRIAEELKDKKWWF